MRDGGIGRVLVAALHQGIADRLPSRLEFYESWLTPEGLRNGTIGLAPVIAALSFLRTEGEPYHHVTRRAGEYAGQWTVEGLSPARRRLVNLLPRPLRARAALRICRDLVRASCAGSRARSRLRRGTGEVAVRGSIFCGVREPSEQALCGFYAAAMARVLASFDLPGSVHVGACRGMGQRVCRFNVALSPRALAPAPSDTEGRASEGT